MQQPNHLSQAEGHLKILRVFQYVYAGLTLLGIGFLVLHYFIMNIMMKSMPEEATTPADGSEPPPMPDFDQIMDVMIWGYIAGAIVLLLIGLVNLLSANFMGQRKNRLFSIIVAGINCLNIPLGTILGIFTIVFLTKPAAQTLYGENQSPLIPPTP